MLRWILFFSLKFSEYILLVVMFYSNHLSVFQFGQQSLPWRAHGTFLRSCEYCLFAPLLAKLRCVNVILCWQSSQAWESRQDLPYSTQRLVWHFDIKDSCPIRCVVGSRQWAGLFLHVSNVLWLSHTDCVIFIVLAWFSVPVYILDIRLTHLFRRMWASSAPGSFWGSHMEFKSLAPVGCKWDLWL